MTQPYYTAVSTPEVVVATAGPADPNAGTRAKLYSGLALITPLLSFLASFGVFTGDQANALVGFTTAAVGVLSAFGFGLAATKTNKQVANGTFEAPPPPVVVSPVDNALEQLTTLQSAVNEQVDKAQTRVADGLQLIQAAASLLPGGAPANVGGVVGGVGSILPGPLGDLVQDLADRAGKL